jgi:uncharacterized DUF497 family protein
MPEIAPEWRIFGENERARWTESRTAVHIEEGDTRYRRLIGAPDDRSLCVDRGMAVLSARTSALAPMMWYSCYTAVRVRFRFSNAKSEALRKNPKRGISFEEAQEIFSHPYYQDQRREDPEQYRAIGWAKGRMYSLIFEIREDPLGEHFHLVTLWRATREERELYEANR